MCESFRTHRDPVWKGTRLFKGMARPSGTVKAKRRGAEIEKRFGELTGTFGALWHNERGFE